MCQVWVFGLEGWGFRIYIYIFILGLGLRGLEFRRIMGFRVWGFRIEFADDSTGFAGFILVY